MCQSIAQGGRRCATKQPAGLSLEGARATLAAGLETDDEIRAQEGAYTASLQLTDDKRRLFTLRHAGWTGAIDQDGYPVGR